MLRFFKSQQPATLFIIPVIVFFLWAQTFFIHPFVINESEGFLYNLVTGFLKTLPDFVKILITMALVSLEAIYLNTIFNRYEVLYKNSYLPAFIFALLMSFALPLLQFHPVILVNLVLLRALDKIFMLFKNDFPISPLFDSFFLISIASLIYFPTVAIFVLFMISLAILRPFNFREWFISFIAFSLPYLLLSIYFFWTDQFIIGWKNILKNFILKHPDIGFTVSKPQLTLFILFGLIILLASRKLIQNFYKNTVRTRSYQQILFLYFLVVVAASVFLNIIPFYYLTMLVIPLVVFLGYFFLTSKKRTWYSELLLWGMLILIIWNHF